MATTPPLFGTAVPRQCTRWMGGRNCAADPVVHVAWIEDDEGIDAGFVCEDHMDELGRVWKFEDSHPVGHDCGMPGARWYREDKTCRCDDELAPARESVEAVALPVPV